MKHLLSLLLFLSVLVGGILYGMTRSTPYENAANGSAEPAHEATHPSNGAACCSADPVKQTDRAQGGAACCSDDSNGDKDGSGGCGSCK